MTERNHLLRRQSRMRFLLALFLIPAIFLLLRVLGVWIGLDAIADPKAFERSITIGVVLGLAALVCWAHLKTLADKLSAASEHP